LCYIIDSEVKKMASRRYFVLMQGGMRGREGSVFTGRNPRQAALKAASRGNNDIWLKERGARRYHHFRGSRRRVAAPENRPDWMASTVWKPAVSKVGIVRVARKKAATARKGRGRRTARTVRRASRTTRRRTTRRRTTRRRTATRRRTVKRPARRAKRTTQRRRR
jgi:hypothetical protein